MNIRPGTSSATAANVVFLLACAGLVAGTFLPWTSAKGGVSLSATEWAGSQALVLTVLGACGVLASSVSLARQRAPFEWMLLVIGSVSLGLSLHYFFGLFSTLGGLSADRLIMTVSIGAGLYVSVATSFAVFAESLILVPSVVRRRKDAHAKPPIVDNEL